MSQLPQAPGFSIPVLATILSVTVPTPAGAVSENTLQQRQLLSPENAAAAAGN